MKTAIKVIENDYLNFDTVGVIVNISMETDEMRTLFYHYNTRDHRYYIFPKMMDVIKFGISNEGASDVMVADKLQIKVLEEKPFDGWLMDKLEHA